MSGSDTFAAGLSQSERLRRDVRDSQAAVARLRASCPGGDDRRLLALVTAARTSEQYLPYTVPLVLRQAEVAGLGVDLVIGMNNGYRCPELVDSLAAMPGVPITVLESTAKPSLHAAGLVVDPAGAALYRIEPPRTPHRVFVVHQPAGPWSAGKDVMLLDLIDGLLLPNMQTGWGAPHTALVFDAEAVFVEHEPDDTLAAAIAQARSWLERSGGHPVRAALAMAADAPRRSAGRSGFDIASPGLARLLAEWRGGTLDVLGPATRFCAFGAPRTFRGVPVLMPLPAEPISAVHRVYNETCGVLPGCSCMSGAATLARTDVLLGMLSVILARYPDIYAEDAIFTVLAEQAGLRLRLARDVQITNRCASRNESAGEPPRPAWVAQIIKWYRGFDQVEQLYGAGPCASVLGPGTDEFLAAAVAIAARDLTADADGAKAFLQDVSEAGPAFDEIRKTVAAMRDVA